MKTPLPALLALGVICAAEEAAGTAVVERYVRPSDAEPRRKLTPLQYAVTQKAATERPHDNALPLGKAKEIYLAGGCFWGTEHYFKMIAGVVDTEVGCANGVTANPTYKEVCTDKTRFAETVRVVYDPGKVGLRFLLEMYFKAVDPVSVNRQGHDVGSQYRTGIYYVDPGDRPVIEEAWRAEQARHAQPLAVEKLPLVNFYAAEEYHQDYLEKNPRGYCHLPAALFKLAREATPQNR